MFLVIVVIQNTLEKLFRENGEKPGNFIPLAPGGEMPLKIEKTAKTLEICLPEAIR
jgi:hypothetical protein